jgi:hypothetical protein
MPTLTFDHPVPELTAEEDSQTVAAIVVGIAQLDAGEGIPLEEVRKELARRCSSNRFAPGLGRLLSGF